MSRQSVRTWLVGCALACTSCTAVDYPLEHYEETTARTLVDAPAPSPNAVARLDGGEVERGRYLAEILGCGACHTEGAMTGTPDRTMLFAGSKIGIAYTNPLRDTFPGVVYPTNLTPDKATGLGNWSDAAIAAAIRSGMGPGSERHLRVMAWPLYQHLSDDDTNALVAYLRSIPAIKHSVPAAVPPGQRATTPYVYFGIYRSGPGFHDLNPFH